MRIRPTATSANVIAVIALFVALGGSAFAFKLGKNSVRTKNIRNSAVTEAKLAAGAVGASKLAAGAVGAQALGGIEVRMASKPLNDNANAIPTAFCNPGEKLLGGGGDTSTGFTTDILPEGGRPTDSGGGSVQPGESPAGWSEGFSNLSGGTGQVIAYSYALCLK